jgi:hypothetical protein
VRHVLPKSERGNTRVSEGWQAKEVRAAFDNLMLDVGRNSPPLWCISEPRHPHGSGWHPYP